MENNRKRPKILLVANVAKEHVLKFHVPTIKMLSESGWIVDVACSGQDAIPYCRKQYIMSYKRSPFNLSLFKGIKELKKIVNEGEYDIVYCHTPVGALAARLASINARKKGTKVVYMAHGYYFFKGVPFYYWLIFYPIERILSSVTDSIILINQEDFELTEKKFFNKYKTYLLDGIGFDFSKYSKVDKTDKEAIRCQYRKDMNISDDAFVMIYLAELIPNKNQKLLMRVLREILKKNRNTYLILAGIDHTNGEFEKYAKSIGVYDNVRFLGWRKDVPNLYLMADIATASSIREGLPMNIVEAMASDLPVVASDNRGHRTIIQDGYNGFLVPLKDEKLFVERILKLMEDNNLYNKIAKNAKKDIHKYSTDVVTNKIKQILEEHLV